MVLTQTKIKNIMFDLDGTLIDSSSDVIRILVDTINKYGANLSADTKIKIGPPLIDMVRSVVPNISDEKMKNILEDFRAAYKNDNLDKTVPFSGIIELLNDLKSNNIDVFIVTYKPKFLAMDLLNRHFTGLYKDIVTPTEVKDFASGKTKIDILNILMEKWKINPKESIMVGDAKSDIVCAKAVGITTIGAAYGYGEENEFELADKKVFSTEELRTHINSLLKE